MAQLTKIVDVEHSADSATSSPMLDLGLAGRGGGVIHGRVDLGQWFLHLSGHDGLMSKKEETSG